MIGDVFGGFMMGVGLSAIVMTAFMGRVAKHLALVNQNMLGLCQMLKKKQESDPECDAWDDECRNADDGHWLPDRIDTRDDD